MKKFRIIPILLAAVLLLGAMCPAAFAIEEPAISSAESVIIVDLETGRTIYELNPYEQRSPASLTKIMTVLVAIEAIESGRVSLDDMVTAGQDCRDGLGDDSSSAGIVAGETMSLRDLLYCAMVHSANESCNIIASYIGGSISSFVSMMNEKALELGCTDTHFANTNGLTQDGHYSTAYDLYLITKAAMTHDLFNTLANTITYTVSATNYSAERVLNSSNALISTEGIYGDSYKYQYASGVKTGYTRAAGYCLISTAEKDGKHLLAVVLGCDGLLNSDSDKYENFVDTITLYNWVFNNFEYQPVISTTETITEVDVQYSSEDRTLALRPMYEIELLLPSDADLSQLEKSVTVYEDRLVAPLESGTVLGDVRLTLEGEDIGTVKLVASRSVALSKSIYLRNRILEVLGTPVVKAVLIILAVLIVLYIALVSRYRYMRRKHLREKKRRYAEQERRRREAEAAAAVSDYYDDSDMNS